MIMNIVISITIIVICLYIAYRAFLVYFLRDPAREIPSGDVIVSPADGKILSIVEIDTKKVKVKKGFLGRITTFTKDLDKGPFIGISIFMSPLDVHINRAPMAGEVISVKHSSGKFYKANEARAFENEKVETVIATKIGRIKVIQIAGFLARRIVSFIEKDKRVIKGERIGLIKLGSQVTMILPADKVKICVKKNQRVSAGTTIIGDII